MSLLDAHVGSLHDHAHYIRARPGKGAVVMRRGQPHAGVVPRWRYTHAAPVPTMIGPQARGGGSRWAHAWAITREVGGLCLCPDGAHAALCPAGPLPLGLGARPGVGTFGLLTQTWSAFVKVDKFLILVPILFNLKGNLEMNLSMRMTTAVRTSSALTAGQYRGA